MTELLVVDLLGSGQKVTRADVLAVAEIIAAQLAQEHGRCRPHGDIGPHTVLLDLSDPPETGVRDARLLGPTPVQRPLDWPPAPEGTPGLAADIFALGQVLRSLDAHARGSSDDVGLPPFIQRMINPDPAHRPVVAELLAGFDEGRLRPPVAPVAAPQGGEPAPTTSSPPAENAEPPPKSTWPPAVAAATVFLLVLAGGLWWTNQDDTGADREAGPDRAAVVEGTGPVDDETTDPTATPTDEAGEAPTVEQAPVAGDPPPPERPEPGATLGPDVSASPDQDQNTSTGPGPTAEGSGEFDQAWCRSHGAFIARVQTVNYQATICRNGEGLNYHGVNLIDGLAIRTAATEHGAGWTAHGEEGVTYEVTEDLFEVRQGDTILAREDVATFVDPSQEGDYRPWDLLVTERISYPACDGSAIVVVDDFDNLQGVQHQVQESLDAHPGAEYLNTDAACDSLERPSHERGNYYLVYYWAGQEEDEICALMASTGGYGLRLDDGVAPGEQFTCN